MITTDKATPATWVNTGGMVEVHLVPAKTNLLTEDDYDKDGFLPREFFQVTRPLCGLGIYHGSWLLVTEAKPPLQLCTSCFPEGVLS